MGVLWFWPFWKGVFLFLSFFLGGRKGKFGLGGFFFFGEKRVRLDYFFFFFFGSLGVLSLFVKEINGSIPQ